MFFPWTGNSPVASEVFPHGDDDGGGGDDDDDTKTPGTRPATEAPAPCTCNDDSVDEDDDAGAATAAAASVAISDVVDLVVVLVDGIFFGLDPTS